MEGADAVGESGSTACGDLVRISLRIGGGRVREARFQAFGCGAATAAASAACARLDGAPLDEALRLSAAALDATWAGSARSRRHGPEIVEDAVARALEAWYSPPPRRGRPAAAWRPGGGGDERRGGQRRGGHAAARRRVTTWSA